MLRLSEEMKNEVVRIKNGLFWYTHLQKFLRRTLAFS